MSKRFDYACECLCYAEELLSNYRKLLEDGSAEANMCDRALNFFDCYRPFLLDHFRDEVVDK